MPNSCSPIHGSGRKETYSKLSEAGSTSVQIFDLSGRLVTSLVDSEMLRGDHSVQWNGNNKNGEEVSAGLYLCRIESCGVVETTGLCLLK